MASVFELTNVFELIIDGLDQGPFAEQNFIPEWEQTRLHLFFEFGEELHSLVPELSERGLGNVAPIPTSLPNTRRASFGTGLRSSTLPGVNMTARSSPQSLMTRWTLKP